MNFRFDRLSFSLLLSFKMKSIGKLLIKYQALDLSNIVLDVCVHKYIRYLHKRKPYRAMDPVNQQNLGILKVHIHDDRLYGHLFKREKKIKVKISLYS